MKISDKIPIPPVAAPARPRPAPAGAAAGSPADRISADDAKAVATAIDVARHTVGSARSVRLHQLESAIRGGTYQPNARRIAEQILDDAELAARLEALLTH